MTTALLQDAPAATEASKVPEWVLTNLKAHLRLLRDIRTGVDQTIKSLDEGMGGRGRYEADALNNRKADIQAGVNAVARFREMAARNNVDAEAVLAELGGVPDFTPSERARAWMASEVAGRAGAALETLYPFGYRSRDSEP